VTVGAELGGALHTGTHDVSAPGTPIGGVLTVLIALHAVGKDDLLARGLDGGIRIIDKRVSFGAFAVAFAIILGIEGYFDFVRNFGNVQLCESQRENQEQWEEEVSLEFELQLSQHAFIAGAHFTAADIVVTWSLYAAHLLGWLENRPVLQNFLKTMALRPAFQSVFEPSF